MTNTDPDHTHDLVRVEDAANEVAWETCRTCTYRTEAEPWNTTESTDAPSQDPGPLDLTTREPGPLEHLFREES